MTLMHEFASNWMVHALGWTLLDFCWQGAVVGAMLWSALQLLAGRSSRVRYAAACCALGLLIALPLATFGHLAGVEYGLALHGARVAAGAEMVVGVGGADASLSGRLAAMLEPALPWVMLAWMLGCAVFVLRLSVGFNVTRKLRVLAVSPVPAELQAMFAALRQRLCVKGPVVLMQSALVQVPTVIGWLRPMVLIPVSCFAGMPMEQVEAILCHELAHIGRHDYLVSVVQSVVEALLFYHPAVWWVSQQVRRERECCCDDVAVSVGGDALAYARALTALETRRGMYPQVTLGADGGVLTMRIKRLLIAERSSTASQVAAMVVLAMLVVSGVMVAGTARAEVRPAARVVPVAMPAAATPLAVEAAPTAPARMAKARPAVAQPIVAAVEPSEDVASVEEPVKPQEPVKVAGGVLAGQVLSKVAPVYPADAKAAHVEGAVVLRAIISKTGEVENLQVISGPKELMASALDAVRQWTYKPYLLNGEPVEVETTITVNYRLAS
jgi:TonB family protein